MKRFYRCKEVGDQLGLAAVTVRKYANEGKINCSRNAAGQRVFTQEDIDEFLGVTTNKGIVFYVRSSSGDANLIQSQINELTKTYGEPKIVFTDKSSGLNEKRPGLQRLFKAAENGEFSTVCITYKDRLTRFGFTYIEKLLKKDNVNIVILNNKIQTTIQEELLQDFMSLIASFTGKFYRLRSLENQKKLLRKAKEELDA